MLRFSLASFLVAVAFLSLVFAGFAHPNEYWMRIVATATFAVLFIATISAIAWQESGRWFWIGFAVAGWGYLAMDHYGETRSVLLTHFAVSQLDELLETSTPSTPPNVVRMTWDEDILKVYTTGNVLRLTFEEAEQKGYLKYVYTYSTMPRSKHFRTIGHYAWASILGCLGGALSLWLHRKSTTTTG